MWRLFGLMAALLASGVGVGAEGESAPAVPVVTAEVTEQPRDRSTEFVARVRAIEAVDVRARVEGVIDQVNFTGGERVEEGDPLFALDRRRYEAALDHMRRATTIYRARGERAGATRSSGALKEHASNRHAFLRHVHFGLNLEEAIDAPEFHTNHAPSSFYPREASLGHLAVERRLGDEKIAALGERGHNVAVFDDYALGYVTAATRADGLLKAAASPRRALLLARALDASGWNRGRGSQGTKGTRIRRSGRSTHCSSCPRGARCASRALTSCRRSQSP